MKKVISGVMVVFMAIMMGGCSTASPSGDLKEVTLVLDYAPNTNHTGIYVAQEQGLFEKQGLKVNIIEPGDNNTSATLVATNKGQFGISYQEDVTYALSAQEALPIKAIATIIQHNTSGFASLKEANITSPKDFEGKVYAGWQAPSEEAVIKAVMNANNADFRKLSMVGSDGSGFASLKNGIDLLWVFEGWDLAKAKMEKYDYNYMPLRELDERLDYYTPVIITNQDMIEKDSETVQKFMNAVKEGYEYTIKNPDEAATILHKSTPEYDLEYLKQSQAFLSEEYAKDSETWGLMKDSVWDNYTDFMYENQLITKKLVARDQYTNEFIK